VDATLLTTRVPVAAAALLAITRVPFTAAALLTTRVPTAMARVPFCAAALLPAPAAAVAGARIMRVPAPAASASLGAPARTGEALAFLGAATCMEREAGPWPGLV
jgi:hypothetical protein